MLNGKIILVVEDDPTTQRYLEVQLQKQRAKVITASTGEEGFEKADQCLPDIILLDVILPGMKGRKVCVRLKANEATKAIPVIFLTSKNSPDDVMAELLAGAHSHLTKPVDIKRLYSEIQRVLKSCGHED